MKNLKHLIALIMVFAMMLCLCACTNDGGNETSEPVSSSGSTNESTEPSTEPSTEASEPDTDEPTYTVKVVDQDNNPMANVMVQLCLESCVPAMTNEEGVAEFYLPEADYHASVSVMPDGYAYATEETEFYFAAGENSLTITLNAEAAE